MKPHSLHERAFPKCLCGMLMTLVLGKASAVSWYRKAPGSTKLMGFIKPGLIKAELEAFFFRRLRKQNWVEGVFSRCSQRGYYLQSKEFSNGECRGLLEWLVLWPTSLIQNWDRGVSPGFWSCVEVTCLLPKLTGFKRLKIQSFFFF